MAINIKPSHKGLLHEKLGVPQGKKIPAQKIEKAERSKSPALRKEAQFAENAKHFKHGGEKRNDGNADDKPRRARNTEGNPGFHPSTKAYEHEGREHTSKDR